MKKEYIKTFTEHLRNSDHLIILPIYYAGGSVARDITSNDLVRGITAGGKSAKAVKNRKDILNPKTLSEYRSYVVFGARDETLSEFTREIARTL